MSFLSPHPQGVLLRIWAKAGASRNEILGAYRDCLKVSIQAPREKGKANKALVKLLKKKLSLTHLEIISGHTSQQKQILVGGISLEDLRERLEKLEG